jgi:pimeloyl-ACP methyl ester carboxylesterase
LVLQHGFTQCLEDWSECGYVAALRPRYRLILVDARGHGGGDKPRDETSYTLDRRVANVTSVLDAVGVEKGALLGLLEEEFHQVDNPAQRISTPAPVCSAQSG